MEKLSVFLSYSWEDNEIADDIYNYFMDTHEIELHRDKIKIESWKSIKTYMKSIKDMDYAILLISENYLQSSNCMYEVLQLIKDEQYRDKIFPVVISNNIYTPMGRIKYIRFWKEKFDELEKALIGLSAKEIGNLGKDLKRYEDIKNSIAEFLDVVSDMNNPDIENVNQSIEKVLSDNGLIKKRSLIDIAKFLYVYDYYLSIGDDEVRNFLTEISDTYSGFIREYFETAYKKKSSYFHINDKNKKFWDNFVTTNDEKVKDGLIEFLYSNRDLFVEVWYKEYPELFKLIASKHKIFIQEQINPLLENNWYIDDIVFWKLLCEILEYNPALLDLDKVTNKYQKVMMISKYNLQQNEIDILNKFEVLKLFICNACKEYFYNDSSAHWDYYSYSSYSNDSYPEKCFNLVNFDIELVDRLESAYKYLLENVKLRDNYDSKENGRIRRNSYDRVIATNKEKIISVIANSVKTLDDYPTLKESMSRQKLI